MERQHVLTVALMEDRPDALATAVGLLHRRAFQYDSLAFGRSERPGIARLTIALQADGREAERLTRELERCVHVLGATSMTSGQSVRREHLLIKVTAEASQRTELLQLAEVFRAHTLDLSPTCLSFEVTGSPDRLDALTSMLQPYGILELVRSAPLAMARGSANLGAAHCNTSWLERFETSQPPNAKAETTVPTSETP